MTKRTFQSTSAYDGDPGFRERSGQEVEVLRQLGEEEYDKEEVGDMYVVRFADGVETHAFADELCSGTGECQCHRCDESKAS